MKQVNSNKETPDYILWWNGLEENEKGAFNIQENGRGKSFRFFTDEEILSIYKAENPSLTTEPEKELTNLSVGHTVGEWKVNDHAITASKGVICSMRFFRNGKSEDIITEQEAEANALRIVQSVNNHDALVSALKELVDKIYSNPLTADIGYYKPELKAAKELLNSIK